MSAQEAKSMRDDLNEAIEQLDADESLQETPQEILSAASDDETPPADETPASEDKDKDTPPQSEADEKSPEPPSDKEGQSSASAQGGKGESHKQDTKADEKSSTDEKAPTDSLKAPVAWSPKEREQWSKVPRPLQERILAREQEVERTIADTKDARTLHQDFGRIVQAYKPVLAAEGVQHPLQAVESLFNVVARLRMGTPQQKAHEVSQIIAQYGIDIPTLDTVLSGSSGIGNGQHANPQMAEFNQLLDQKLGPVQQFISTVQQQQNAAHETERVNAETTVEEFSKTAEFISDVREDMADMIDLAAKRGQTLTLQEAYDKACALHPEISKIINERAESERLLGQQNTIKDKQNAAVSLNGKKTGDGSMMTAGNLRDQIAQAWDDQLSE